MNKIHQAIIVGDTLSFQQLIEATSALEGRDEDGFTPLHLASEYDRISMVESLLARGADTDALTDNGISALGLATIHNNLEVVRLLLRYDSTPMKGKDGFTPLHVAAYYGQSAVIKLFKDAGCDMDITDNSNRTALHWSSQEGTIDAAKALINMGANIEAQDDTGSTPLHIAVGEQHTNIVEMLLSQGANVNATDYNLGTPLHKASAWGYCRMVRILLDASANIDARDQEQMSPLLYAVMYNDISVAKILIERGAGTFVTQRDEKCLCDLIQSDEMRVLFGK